MVDLYGMSNIHKTTPFYGKNITDIATKLHSLNDYPVSEASGYDTGDVLILGTKPYRIRYKYIGGTPPIGNNYLVEYPSISNTSNDLIYTNFPCEHRVYGPGTTSSSRVPFLRDSNYGTLPSVLVGTTPAALTVYIASVDTTTGNLYAYRFDDSGDSNVYTFSADDRYINSSGIDIDLDDFVTGAGLAHISQKLYWCKDSSNVYSISWISGTSLQGIGLVKWSTTTHKVVDFEWIYSVSSTATVIKTVFEVELKVSDTYACFYFQYGPADNDIDVRHLTVINYSSMSVAWDLDLISASTSLYTVSSYINANDGHVYITRSNSSLIRYDIASGSNSVTMTLVVPVLAAKSGWIVGPYVTNTGNPLYTYTSGGTITSRGNWILVPEFSDQIIKYTSINRLSDDTYSWTTSTETVGDNAIAGGLMLSDYITKAGSASTNAYGDMGFRGCCTRFAPSLLYVTSPALAVGVQSLYYYLFDSVEGVNYGRNIGSIDPTNANTWEHPVLKEEFASPTSVTITKGTATGTIANLTMADSELASPLTYSLAAVTNTIDAYFEYTLPTKKTLTRIFINGWLKKGVNNTTSDFVKFQMYNWVTSGWVDIIWYSVTEFPYDSEYFDKWAVIQYIREPCAGTGTPTKGLEAIYGATKAYAEGLLYTDMPAAYTGTGVNLGKVRVRTYGTTLETGTELFLNQLIFVHSVAMYDIDIGEVYHIVDGFATIIKGNL